MARPQGTSPRAQRLIALLAVCAIAIATAFAFGRVFVGHGPTWELMAVALISALIASALERRNLLLATLLSAVGLAVVIGLFVFPGTTWHGLPTLETLRHALDASHLVGEQARIQVAPSPPLKPLMLASIVAMWAAIFSCHALAFRAGSPLLALLPPVVMVAFADTVLEEFIKPLYGVTFLAAALAIIFADALRRVQGWGPVWTGPGSRARLSATASRGARRVAVAAVGTAMIVPFLVPGFGSKAIFDISATNDSDRVRIDPLVSIKASLERNTPVEVFQVRSDVPAYWRMLSLSWNAENENWAPDFTDPGEAVTADTLLAAGSPGTEPLEQTFTVEADLGYPWLPAAYPPQQIDVTDTTVRYNASTGTATLDDLLDAGDLYQVTSARVQPTPEQLANGGVPTVDRPTGHVTGGHPRRCGGRPQGDRGAVDGGRGQRLRAHPRDPGPSQRRLGLHVRHGRPCARRLVHDPPVPDGDQAWLLPAVRERHGHDAAHARVPHTARRGVHAGRARPQHGGVARHHEGSSRVGRGAVPDVRVARVRADARPHEPHRERVPEPGGQLPARDAGLSRRRG